MSARNRLILAVSLLVAMLLVSTLGMATATTFRHGNIRVQVQGDGENVNLLVPATLAEAAIALAPVGMLRDEIPSHELEPFLPALAGLVEELENLPDAVFVEVRSSSEQVRIEKRDGRFIIDVQERDQTVHISIPATTVNRAVRKLKDLA